jgi:hypothetical protein
MKGNGIGVNDARPILTPISGRKDQESLYKSGSSAPLPEASV